jgi:hypothetical protein
MVAVHAANQAYDAAVAAELGSLLHAHRWITDSRWRLEAIARARALALRFQLVVPRLDRELTQYVQRARCPQALREPLVSLVTSNDGAVASRASEALFTPSWHGAAMHGVAAALSEGDHGRARSIQMRAASRCDRRAIDRLIEWGYVRTQRGWPELVVSLALAASEERYRPSARLAAGLVDVICDSADVARIDAARRLATRVPRPERAIARAHLVRLALQFGGLRAALDEARSIREVSIRNGAYFLIALGDATAAEHVESPLLRQLAYCEAARRMIVNGHHRDGLRLLRKVTDPRCRAHRRLVHDTLQARFVPDDELECAFNPAPWLAARVLDAKTRRCITLTTELLKWAVSGGYREMLRDAASNAGALATSLARDELLATLERSGMDVEDAVRRMHAQRPLSIAPLLITYLSRRMARICWHAPLALPTNLTSASTALDRALFDERIALSPSAPSRKRVLIDASRACVRTALRAPAAVPTAIVDARLRTLVHLGGELAASAIANALDAPVGPLDPPFQNSPTRLRQNSPTRLFSVDHG